jgi:hypothetical protein
MLKGKKKKSNAGGITIPNFKLHIKTTITKIACQFLTKLPKIYIGEKTTNGIVNYIYIYVTVCKN